MQYLIVANSVPGEPPAPRCCRLGSLVRTRTMKRRTMFAGDGSFKRLRKKSRRSIQTLESTEETFDQAVRTQ